MMMDDDLDAKVNVRQQLNEAALMEHQQKEQLARDQFLRRQMADEAALEKAAFVEAASNAWLWLKNRPTRRGLPMQKLPHCALHWRKNSSMQRELQMQWLRRSVKPWRKRGPTY